MKEYTDAELIADIQDVLAHPDKISKEEAERNEYFTNPENAEEVNVLFSRMELIKAMYKARNEAGLTQKQVAERIGTNQTYIAALERGRKNITISTLIKYAAACGKKIAVTLL